MTRQLFAANPTQSIRDCAEVAADHFWETYAEMSKWNRESWVASAIWLAELPSANDAITQLEKRDPYITPSLFALAADDE